MQRIGVVAGMDFDEVATRVSEILRSKDIEPTRVAERCCWDNGINRVCLSAPQTLRAYKYLITREHYETTADGSRYLSPRQPHKQLSQGDTPERIADIIANDLTDPY